MSLSSIAIDESDVGGGGTVLERTHVGDHLKQRHVRVEIGRIFGECDTREHNGHAGGPRRACEIIRALDNPATRGFCSKDAAKSAVRFDDVRLQVHEYDRGLVDCHKGAFRIVTRANKSVRAL